MHVDVNQIVIGSGSTSLIGLIVELLGRDNHYAMEEPGYTKIYQLFKSNDVKLSLITLDHQGLSVDSLKQSHASIIHITPSHQFPSGIVMPISKRIELLQWVSENQNRYVIEDDYDSEFRYQGKPIPSIHGLDQSDSIIYMNTFTKTLAPSFRINYMVLPKRLLTRYEKISSYHGCTVPNLEQYILYKFMSDGHFERHINRMKIIYKQKIDTINKIIQKYSFLSVFGHESGLHCILEIHKKIDEEKLLIYFEDNGIKIASIKQFYHEHVPNDKHQFILGYAGIAIENVNHYFELLCQTIDDFND
jgi:GntR family transcriptional regulator/MocR family aminotransferase